MLAPTVVLLASLSLVASSDPVGPTLPWGVHVTFGADPTSELTVMWSTRNVVTPSVVQYSVNGGAQLTTTGEEIPFSDSNNVQTLHRVYVTGLAPGSTVSYRVGDGGSNVDDDVFNVTMAPTSNWSPKIAVYGDMGISSNAQNTMPWLLADAAAGLLDVVVHIGDAG